MKLLFDIGNTLIKWAYCIDDEIQPSASIDAASVSSSALNDVFKGMTKPDQVWLSNVGDEKILLELTRWCDEAYQIKPNIIQVSKSSCGIHNNYMTQETLGVDRWVAAIGARAILPTGHIIIVDAGTAVTIDWLSQQSKFEGGVILPGFNLMHESLNNNTAGIKSDYAQANSIIGKTTEACVNAGISFGLVGAIERVIQEMQEKIAEPYSILLTGGSAPSIKSMSKLEMILQKDLVLLGVAKASTEVR